jgi:hypothetical protein
MRFVFYIMYAPKLSSPNVIEFLRIIPDVNHEDVRTDRHAFILYTKGKGKVVVSSQLHEPVALPPRKESLVPIG